MAIAYQSPVKLNFTTSSSSPISNGFPNPIPNPPSLYPIKTRFSFGFNLSSVSCKTQTHVTVLEPEPVFASVTSFAPATIANLGPGFDFLGCAVDGLGDLITVRVDPGVKPGEVSISDISGAGRKLSRDPLWNSAGISAISVMKMLKIQSVGLSISLEKGLPLGSGLGSSAASAAAAAVAVNELFGRKLSVSDLVLAGLESETKVSGYHADNIAPSIMGAPTKKMRAALPPEVTMSHHIWNCSQAGALVAAILQGDSRGLGKALSSDKIVEPRRGPLIPGMEGVKKAALKAGAFGCTISGAGPTLVAVTDEEEIGREIGDRMVEAFMKEGNLKALAMVKKLDRVGARLVSSNPR
ncbi:hypothetical protein HAX54_034886 [Datura stramonium]|uniref:Homoserine kinase n=1 Tax=Datura stramonium TaxID=4076 RepID=A0ABS8SEM1_DATST|nr:hypothetical protein [Datura stramonium]